MVILASAPFGRASGPAPLPGYHAGVIRSAHLRVYVLSGGGDGDIEAGVVIAAERAAVAALTDQLDQPVLETAVSQALGNPLAQQVILGSQVSGSNAIIVLMPDGTGYLAEHSPELFDEASVVDDDND